MNTWEKSTTSLIAEQLSRCIMRTEVCYFPISYLYTGMTTFTRPFDRTFHLRSTARGLYRRLVEEQVLTAVVGFARHSALFSVTWIWKLLILNHVWLRPLFVFARHCAPVSVTSIEK